MVQRFDIITIGSLSRNRFWGEGEDQSYRRGICTCTLITGDGFRLLVDPSLTEAEAMAAELDRRAGLTLADVDTVFLTHAHADHLYGLPHFVGAEWLAAAPVAESINASGRFAQPVGVAGALLAGCLDVVATPGHTLDHHSLRFDCDGLSVTVAGDAVMTRDFYRARAGYHNSADHDAVRATIDRLATIADAIVPGHDNWFLTGRGAAT